MIESLKWFTVDELVDLAGRADRCADLCSGLPAEYYCTFATAAENLAALLSDLDRSEPDEIAGVHAALAG